MTIGEIIGLALLAFAVVTGARVAYGSWFWELSKSWWHTEQEIAKLRYDLERSVKLLDQAVAALNRVADVRQRLRIERDHFEGAPVGLSLPA
jgi:hypothetical protein